MFLTLHKRQLTYAQRKDIIRAILHYGLVYISSLVRRFQCSPSTVWRMWSLYKNNGYDFEYLFPKARHSKHPNEHTQAERDLIISVLKEFPRVRYTRIYTLLYHRGYTRSYKGMWGYINRHNLRNKVKYEHIPRTNKPIPP
jgi:hypothetical protein